MEENIISQTKMRKRRMEVLCKDELAEAIEESSRFDEKDEEEVLPHRLTHMDEVQDIISFIIMNNKQDIKDLRVSLFYGGI